MSIDIFTIGHSTQNTEQFMRRLQAHSITAVADVRSTPYSRRNPQFNREELVQALKAKGIRYVFLGKELGARSDDDCCYREGKVQYSLLARTDLFKSGIARVAEGAQSYRIALMCAEKDPLECHRTILVARELVNRGYEVQHILADSSLESHSSMLSRLIKLLGMGDTEDLFRSSEMTLSEAYDRQADRIAYDRNAHRAEREKHPEPLYVQSE
jgi:uncharacterized protein (DUF488 family)